jgi:hypothetical protein
MERTRYYAYLTFYFELDHSKPPISIIVDGMEWSHAKLVKTNINNNDDDVDDDDDRIPPLFEGDDDDDDEEEV